MKLLKIQIDRKEQELYLLGEELKQVIKDKNIALAKGDLSENQDYKIAKEREKDIVEKLQKFRAELRGAEEISIDSTNVFGFGSLLAVKLFRADGTPMRPIVSGEPVEGEDPEIAYTDYLFLLPKGNILFDGVLSINTELGKLIYNKESADRVLKGKTRAGYSYNIKKLTIADLGLFLDKHPESSKVLDALFKLEAMYE